VTSQIVNDRRSWNRGASELSDHVARPWAANRPAPTLEHNQRRSRTGEYQYEYLRGYQRDGPRWHRLTFQQHGDVKQLGGAVHPDHSGVGQQRAEHRIGAAAAAVWECPARVPGADRPLRNTTTGRVRDTSRAMRRKRRGLPIDSKYSAITAVRGSSAQASSRSLPLTSALLPSDTIAEIPKPRRAAACSTEIPKAPDCEASAIRPGSGRAVPNVASRRTAGSVLSTPNN
jgi:hypothetical protein